MDTGVYNPPDGPNWEDQKNLPNHIGDCTNFVWTVVRAQLGSAWPYGIARTVTFGNMTTTSAKSWGYVIIDSATVREGDVIVRVKDTTVASLRSGHAGIFIAWMAGGHPIAYANNGSPAYVNKKRNDRKTGVVDLKRTGNLVPYFFRPATP